MCSIVNQSTARKSDQSEVTISGRLQEKEPIGKQDTKRNNQSTPSIQSLRSIKKSRDERAETHTSFDMLRKSKAKDQTQALNIPVKIPLGGGRYAELTEWNGSKSGSEILENREDSYQSRCQLIITTVESLLQYYTSGGRFDQSSERRRTRGLEI